MIKTHEGGKREKAFTLIEMIVVIVIISIVAALIVPVVFQTVEKARAAKAMEDFNSIKTAAKAFLIDVGVWPGSQWGTISGDPLSPANYGEGFVSAPVVHSGTAEERARAQDGIANWDGPYLGKWPLTPWGMPFMWDYNNGDSNGDGISGEHLIWLDLASGGGYTQNNKVPAVSRVRIDLSLENGDGLNSGMVQEADRGFFGPSLFVIVAEGY